MAYSEFHYPDVFERFGLTHDMGRLFTRVPPMPPLANFATVLPASAQLGSLAHTGFARAVWVVGPLLADFWGRYHGQISVHGGVELNADPDAGLVGPCDFVLTRSCQWPDWVQMPIALVVQTRPNSPPGDLGPAVATAVGAQRLNRAAGHDAGPVYGCATNGSEWLFFRLDGRTVTFDMDQYTISRPDRILGILTHIIGPVPAAAAA